MYLFLLFIVIIVNRVHKDSLVSHVGIYEYQEIEFMLS